MAGTSVLGTRVARRVLVLFSAGAIVPMGAMAWLSFTAITRQLAEQRIGELERLGDVSTQSIIERLVGFQVVLGSIGTLSTQGGSPSSEAGSPGDGPRAGRLPPGVSGVGVDGPDGFTHLAGDPVRRPPLTERDSARLSAGEPLLRLEVTSGGVSALMAVPGPSTRGRRSVVWGSLVADSIWAPAATRAADPLVEDLCALDADGRTLFCMREASALPGVFRAQVERALNSGTAYIDSDGGERLVAWRDVYLRPSFDTESWTVVLSHSGSEPYGDVDAFVYNLLLSMLVGLAAVLLLTHLMVRRTMEPLRALAEGTHRIASHELDARVPVGSTDEFGDLAASFNTMAERLGKQFRQLEAGRAIDHAAMAAGDPLDAASALAAGLADVLAGKRCLVAVADFDVPGLTNVVRALPDGSWQREVHRGVDLERQVPSDSSAITLLPREVPAFFGPWTEEDGMPVLIVPMRVGETTLGAAAVGASEGDFSADAVRGAEDLVGLAAVAFGKLKADRELAAMTWEALRALANAIDAKSPWTAGHSERVTALALAIGQELDLDTDDMNTLHRGGLLHDVGKIGVPADVLDFEGPLDEVMRAQIQDHPVRGARILEPLRAFRPIIPIVLYHHESWDGTGYPEGLSGTDIPRLARLLSVADVFDAMVSPRPYRPAMAVDHVLTHLRAQAGVQLDPDMVAALLRVMERGWVHHAAAPAEVSHAER